MAAIKPIYGTALLYKEQAQTEFPQYLEILDKYGVKNLDTAQGYIDSEVTLGKYEAASRFVIDTKWRAGFRPAEDPKEIPLEIMKQSLEKLHTSQVDVWFLHAKPHEPPEEYMASVNEAHKAGMFKRFGVSNFYANDLEELYKVCKDKDYVLPSVYQGNYNPVARKQETVLFPLLKKLGMSFHAYSPLAGGFLTKTKEDIKAGAGRFNPEIKYGTMYLELYERPSYLEALAEWGALAEKAGCSKAALAYRWVSYNSALKPENGDGIIIGASSLKQLEQTLQDLQAGPLPDDVLAGIDDVWEKVKHEAPLDNKNRE